MLLESAAEALGVGVADVGRNSLDRRHGRGESMARRLHSATDYVLMWRHLDELAEAGVQMRCAQADMVRQYVHVERLREVLVDVGHDFRHARRNIRSTFLAPEAVELKSQAAPQQIPEDLAIDFGVMECVEHFMRESDGGFWIEPAKGAWP